jgi:hypothetical protein
MPVSSLSLSFDLCFFFNLQSLSLKFLKLQSLSLKDFPIILQSPVFHSLSRSPTLSLLSHHK